jgi:hypothetical protein
MDTEKNKYEPVPAKPYSYLPYFKTKLPASSVEDPDVYGSPGSGSVCHRGTDPSTVSSRK